MKRLSLILSLTAAVMVCGINTNAQDNFLSQAQKQVEAFFNNTGVTVYEYSTPQTVDKFYQENEAVLIHIFGKGRINKAQKIKVEIVGHKFDYTGSGVSRYRQTQRTQKYNIWFEYNTGGAVRQIGFSTDMDILAKFNLALNLSSRHAKIYRNGTQQMLHDKRLRYGYDRNKLIPKKIYNESAYPKTPLSKIQNSGGFQKKNDLAFWEK